MTTYRAAWVLPIVGPPLRNAGVEVEDDRIAAVHAAPLPPAPDVVDLGGAAILPGLVNAHTHLELSWLRHRILPREKFTDWVRDVMTFRRQESQSTVEDAIGGALVELHRSGTALVGDITNTLASAKPLLGSRIGGVVFREMIGFLPARAEEVFARAVADLEAMTWTRSLRGALAAHAPYSVSASLFEAVAAGRGDAGLSVHLAESAAEVEFLQTGSGDWQRLLQELQAWDPAWVAPRCSPVEYLDRIGFLGPRVLAVHCVHATSGDLALLKRHGVTVVTCPRSNRWTGAGEPSIAAFFNSGVRVAMGTDSLASAPDLNLFAELAEARRLVPDVPAGALLRAATLSGAEALGLADDFGSIEMGKRPRLLAVDLPPAVQDVEEYLLSGVRPEQVKWIEEEGDRGRGTRGQGAGTKEERQGMQPRDNV